MNVNTPPGGEPGTRYGALTVLRVETFGRIATVECRCDCGNTHTTSICSLKSSVKRGRCPSCKGCQSKSKMLNGMRNFEPERYMGKRYGRLLVTGVDSDPSRRTAKVRLVCRCDCGAQAVVKPMHLVYGKTTSCGCFYRERVGEMGAKTIVHGHTTHGMLNGHTPIYRAWLKIRAGVKAGQEAGFNLVCHEFDPRWNDFENFLADFGEIGYNQTISRMDNQQTWCKENCFVNIGRRTRPRKSAA